MVLLCNAITQVAISWAKKEEEEGEELVEVGRKKEEEVAVVKRIAVAQRRKRSANQQRLPPNMFLMGPVRLATARDTQLVVLAVNLIRWYFTLANRCTVASEP